MKCPICKTEELTLTSLDDALTARHCDVCGGNWIPSFEYWKWRDAHKENLPSKDPEPNAPNPSTGVLAAKLCPECNRILVKYKVGHGVAFSLDLCGNCGGIWFDKDEWEALRSRNLHDDVHMIFTATWQSRVRSEDARREAERLYRSKFGAEGFEEVRRMKEWIEDHPRKHEILAYLIAG